MSNKVKTLGVLSLSIGIIGLALFCIPIIAFVLATAGLILGIVGITMATKSNEPMSMNIAGTAIAGMAFILGLVWNILIFTKNNNNFFNFNDDYNEKPYFDDVDTNYYDIDSLIMDENDLKNLDPIMNDPDNSPGSAPD